ncbi:S100 calcium binding protein U [Cynoglossus semilaevis]|uniref:S100 calcium binding protein U n=1 Tax=Cynoglossus semilaevis TaxID=244447 RepID=A0A3P8VBA4_CYNSE|nr:uncharacterized protein LOC103394530 [Cynoglossus semilaevis]XP_024920778.1 uncharacterized protein LOC103394530 [Cynoglossus semilaevis]
MEAAIQTLVKVFLRSSKGKESLGRKEFQTLVKTQLGNILTGADSNEAVNNMGKGLDADQDGKVGFKEYMKLVGYLAVSLSEQRVLAAQQAEPPQNATSEQVALSAPAVEAETPEAKAEVKADATPEVTEEAKAEAAAEVKVEANADAKVDAKAEVKEEGETQPEEVKEEVMAAAAEVAAVAMEAATVEVVTKEEVKVEETEKVEDAVETVAAAVEEAVEKKAEEATS